MIRQSKTDQKREGRKVAIPFGEFPDTCPIRALLHWVESANLTTGPLFRSTTKFERPRTTRMSDRIVAELVKKYCQNSFAVPAAGDNDEPEPHIL